MQDGLDAMGWSEVSWRPPGPRGAAPPDALQSEYQSMLHRSALRRLENELKLAIKNIPPSNIPVYEGGVIQSRDANSLPSTPLQSPQQPANGLNDVPGDLQSAAERVYSRSAVQRYVLQELAADLHGSLEDDRSRVPFGVFQKVLSSPNAIELPKLNPFVVTKPRRRHDSADATRQSFLFGASDELSWQQRPQSDNTSSDVAPGRGGDISNGRGQPRTVVFDTVSFPNMQAGFRVVPFQQRSR